MGVYLYGLQVHIEKEILKDLANNGYSLCIQMYLNDGASKPIANMIPTAVAPQSYSSVTIFRWNKKYAIRATTLPTELEHRLSEGGRVGETRTDVLPISTESKDSFVLKQWSDYYVESQSSSAPAKGFAFQPSRAIPNPGASCVVFLTDYSLPGAVPDKKASFYMSPHSVMGGSESQLVPLDQVVVFFSQNFSESSDVIYNGSRTYPQDVDLSNKAQKAYKLSNDKSWSEVPWDIHYES